MTGEEKETKELIEQSQRVSRFRLIVIGGGFLLFPIIATIAKIKADVILIFVFCFGFYLTAIGVLNFLIKRQTRVKRLNELNFIYIIIDFLFLAAILHYSGGIGWIMFFAYIGSLSYSYIILPKVEAFFITFLLLVIINGIGILEYLNILPHHFVFPSFDLYNNFRYLFVTLGAFSGLVISMSATLNFFAGRLKNKNKLLKERAQEIRDTKISLEVRVSARKKELEELAKKLNEEVKEKTKELQKRVNELNEINKTTVKRELRMVELKKEIKRLKEEIKK